MCAFTLYYTLLIWTIVYITVTALRVEDLLVDICLLELDIHDFAEIAKQVSQIQRTDNPVGLISAEFHVQ